MGGGLLPARGRRLRLFRPISADTPQRIPPVLSTSRRAGARRGARVGAIVASAAVVVTLVPALLLSSPSNAASNRAAASARYRRRVVVCSPREQPSPGLAERPRARVNPSPYKAFTLDSSALAGRLAAAPDEAAKGAAPATLQLPAPNGDLVTFEVVESPVMEAGLAAAHPEIKTYAGRSVDGTCDDPPRRDADGLPRVRARCPRRRRLVRRPGLQRRRQPLPLLPRR